MEKKYKWFFIAMILSLVGNACADYALLWYAITKFGIGKTINLDNSVSFFYVGQAIGVVFLSPLLAVLFDKHSKRNSSIILDISYGVLLGAAILLYQNNLLNEITIFILAIITTGLTALHRSSVAFAAIKMISTESNNYIAHYVSIVALSTMFGAATSGVLYQYLEFNGCMLFAMITFIPAIISYLKVFKGENYHGQNVEKKIPLFRQFVEGFHFLVKDRVLFVSCITIAIFNITGSLIPVILGFNLKLTFGDQNPYFGPIIALGLGGGLVFNKYFAKVCGEVKLRVVSPITLIPIVIFFVVLYFSHSYIVAVILYFVACIGSAFRNISTGLLRVKRISSDRIGRVNTIYTAFLFVGQALGGLILVPMFQKYDLYTPLIISIGVTVLSISLSLLFLPKGKLKEYLN